MRAAQLQILLGGTAVAILALSSHVPSAPAPPKMGVEEIEKTTTYNCYNMTIEHGDKTRNVTDLHFRLPAGAPHHIEAPAGWDWTVGPGGTLVFQTPPANPTAGGGSSVPAANPIKANEPLDGFRFCLLKKQDNISAELSYDQGANTTVEIIEHVEAGSGKPVRHNSILRCVKLKITAPEDSDVFDVHLEGSVADSSPHFDGVTLPTGWSGGPGGAGNNEVSIDAAGAPLGKGKSAEIGVCLLGQPEKINWKFTDKNHQDIPNAKGTTTLKY
jgi:hypothetical protein